MSMETSFFAWNIHRQCFDRGDTPADFVGRSCIDLFSMEWVPAEYDEPFEAPRYASDEELSEIQANLH